MPMQVRKTRRESELCRFDMEESELENGRVGFSWLLLCDNEREVGYIPITSIKDCICNMITFNLGEFLIARRK